MIATLPDQELAIGPDAQSLFYVFYLVDQFTVQFPSQIKEKETRCRGDE
jgi:hypothetical protein